MSWSVDVSGRAGKLATVIADTFEKTQGAPKGTPEEKAKNDLGKIAADLCAGYADQNAVVSITAQGSAWNQPNNKHGSLYTKFEIKSAGNFVE